uniref:hypothetical protein n=1 Tax=Vibrio anguillarum TaxID=55601 RepID=UPI001C9C9152
PLKKRDDLGKPSRFADIRKRMAREIPNSFSQKLCFSLRKPNAIYTTKCDLIYHATATYHEL